MSNRPIGASSAPDAEPWARNNADANAKGINMMVVLVSTGQRTPFTASEVRLGR